MKILKNHFILLILLVLSLMPLLDLFTPGLPVTHDGQDHVARIANFYKNLEEGNIIPRWAGNLNWGYGHPILMFLYPLPSYFASLFHFLGFSFIDSLKVVFGLIYVLSGLAFYLWIKSFLSREAALIGASLYLIAPYRFVDLYVRAALGEHVAFLFMPLVLYFMLKISKQYSKFNIVGGAFSLAGLVLSHNAISLMFMPLAFLYFLYLYSKQKNFLKGILIMFALGMGISAFFWIPAFFEGKYTLRDIVTQGDYKTRFVDLKSFLYGEWNYGGTAEFTKQLGIVQWIMIILTLPITFYLYKLKKKFWLLGLGLFLIFLITIFLMSPDSAFIWERVKTLRKFQFPWRILSILVLATSVMGALVIGQMRRFRFYLVFVILALLLFFNRDYWKAQSYKVFPESFFTNIYNGTTDTGESSPIWSVRFMEKRPKSDLEFINGEGSFETINRTSTLHKYSIEAIIDSTIRENTLYFPGWTVLVDAREVPVEFQDPSNRGVMTFLVEKGKHDVILKFTETKLRLLSNYLSLVSLLSIFIFLRIKRI